MIKQHYAQFFREFKILRDAEEYVLLGATPLIFPMVYYYSVIRGVWLVISKDIWRKK